MQVFFLSHYFYSHYSYSTHTPPIFITPNLYSARVHQYTYNSSTWQKGRPQASVLVSPSLHAVVEYRTALYWLHPLWSG